jgi:hypothetical protein
MTDESVQEVQKIEDTAPIPAPVVNEYTGRITRTLVAIFAGCIAGYISNLTDGVAQVSSGSQTFLFPVLVMIAAIIIQKHIFMAMRIDVSRLEKKDWFYQGFMTFAFWFVTWTILLTGTGTGV